jgi:hypothetical protein
MPNSPSDEEQGLPDSKRLSSKPSITRESRWLPLSLKQTEHYRKTASNARCDFEGQRDFQMAQNQL